MSKQIILNRDDESGGGQGLNRVHEIRHGILYLLHHKLLESWLLCHGLLYILPPIKLDLRDATDIDGLRGTDLKLTKATWTSNRLRLGQGSRNFLNGGTPSKWASGGGRQRWEHGQCYAPKREGDYCAESIWER